MKEGQRVREFLKHLRALPIIDEKTFRERHGHPSHITDTPGLDVSDLPGKLGFPRKRKPSQPVADV